MKTNYFSAKKVSFYTLLGFLTLIVVSCGSYQNSTNFDNDGVYGNSQNKTQQNAPNNQYQSYFKSLQAEEESQEIFVDIDNYNSNYSQTNENQAYPSWGTNYDNVTVYDNSWGYGYWNSYWTIGFGYPYYGWGYPYYGWGYPYYGWGYPYYGWGYPYYGYGNYNNYYYNNYGRRGSLYGSNSYNNNYYYNQNNATGRRTIYNSYNSNSNYIPRTSIPRRTNSYSTGNVRNTTRTYTNSINQNNTAPRSNYSSGATRSTGSSGSYSGSSGSSGGGGRSSGGGGGGGRR